MLAITKLMFAAFTGLGFSGAAKPVGAPAMVRPQTSQFVVFFESTDPYPIAASQTFGTRSEAEMFAQHRSQNGYTVRIVEMP